MMEFTLERFASPIFFGLMLVVIVGLLYQVVLELKGIRTQLKALFDQRNSSSRY